MPTDDTTIGSPPPPPAPPVPTYDQVRRWALVLDSQDIPNDLVHGPNGWGLVVDAAYADQAAMALRSYHEENADRPAPAPPMVRATPRPGLLNGATVTALVAVALMAAFHLLVVAPDGTGAWYAAGTAASGPMLSGEPWRAVTALTLHADLQHLLANSLAGLLFLALVFAAVGPGVGAWLVLAAGTLGNLANASLRGPGYGGVGASTAIFGAIGVLAGLRFGRYRRRQASRGEAWAAVFAAVMLLALTGLSPETDILAHLWGFAVGLGLGLLAGRLPPLPIGPRGQWLLAVAALAIVVGAWWLALRPG
jgi:rhomboid protease GluP